MYVGTPIGGDHVRRRKGRGGGSEGGKPCRSLTFSTWSPRGFGVCFVWHCTDAVQIGKGRLSCLFVFFVLILVFLITVSDVPMQVS